MNIEIINKQKIKRVSLKNIKLKLKKIFSLLNITQKSISILLCDNCLIQKLNKKYFKRNTPTDVIAFPLADRFCTDYLGEVAVSVEEAVIASKRYRMSWQKELNLYLVHGILHLLGYNDRTDSERKVMEKKQRQILEELFQ